MTEIWRITIDCKNRTLCLVANRRDIEKFAQENSPGNFADFSESEHWIMKYVHHKEGFKPKEILRLEIQQFDL